MQNKKKGFTLIELLVVMAIIAVLVTMMVYAINSARMQSRNTQRRNTINTAKAALESYYASRKMYPNVNNTVTWLLSTAPNAANTGGVSSFVTGITAAQTNDPNSENTRMCYRANGNNRYWMWLVPESSGTAYTTACATALPAADVAEDFSVR